MKNRPKTENNTEADVASASHPLDSIDLTETLDRIADGVFSVDDAWRITYINRRFETMLGIRRTQFLHRNLWESYPKLKETIYHHEFHRAVQEGVVVAFERFSALYNCWFEITAHPSGTGLSVFFRDITQRKQAEEALRRSNERFRLAAKTEAIYDWDLTTNELYWGEGLHVLFGYTSGELQIHNWAEALHPEDRNALTTGLQQSLADPMVLVWEQDYRIRHKDGHFCYASECGHIVRDAAGKAIRMVGMMKNITDRKRAEVEMHKLALIAKNTNNAVFVTDLEHRIEWANEAFTTIFGYTENEVLGKRAGELLDSPRADPATMAFLRAQSAKGAAFHVEVINRTKTGRDLWCDSQYQPVHNHRGEVIQFFCLITDITHRRQLEQERASQQHKTTIAFIRGQERERTLIGRELHDNINQLLTTVKLYQGLIRSGEFSTGELATRSEQLLQQAITEIRCLSKRLSAPTLGNVTLQDSVGELLSRMEATGQFEVAADLAVLEQLSVGEELHLAIFRILQEQITNISWYAEAALVAVSFALENSVLVFTIRDDGKGFDIRHKRSGIGITNMLMRAESVGGTLVIDSAPGAGCTLTAKFPLPAS